MKIPNITIEQLLEAGVHLGHKTLRWNPKMKSFIFGSKNSIHIIDLVQTLEMINAAMLQIHKCVSSGGKMLFVSTKKQATESIALLAKDTSQYYVNHRWLGGTLTNWKTISNTIARLKSIQETLDEEESAGLTKKELLKLTRERDKLELSIGGIKNMGSLPDLIFVIDTVREQIAIKEANKLNIPIAAIIDTNCDPEGITYPIPGNDDSTKSIKLYCDLVSQAALDGISIQSQKVQEETQDKKEKPQKETASKEDNKSKELSDTPKTDDGKEIRKAFIADKKNVLISADYNQIEMRILADMADVKELKKAFKNNEDIHSLTASQVFNVPINEVNEDLRRKAKTINFGIIYGITQYGLAKQISVSNQEALDFINAYFKKFPQIKDYMNSTVNACRKQGYVSNIFGRRIHLKGINDKNFSIRSFQERAAINAPIQGSAADIIRLAMIKINRLIEEDKKLQTKMLLQIHDELIFECLEKDEEYVKKTIKEAMVSISKSEHHMFSIPLEVNVNSGYNWGEAH